MPYLFKKYYPVRDIVFCVGEGMLIFLTFCGVHLYLIGDYLYCHYHFSTHILQAASITVIFQLCLYFYDLYDLSRDISLSDTATRMTQAFGLGCIILAALYYSNPRLITALDIFWPGYFAICTMLLLWRWSYYKILRKRIFVRNVLVMGTGRFASEIAREIEGKHDSAYRIAAFSGSGTPEYNPNQVPVYEVIHDMVSFCHKGSIMIIVMALDDRRRKTPSSKLLACKFNEIAVKQGVDFYESITGKIPVERVDPSAIFFSDGFTVGRWTKKTKRIMDIGLSMVGLIVASPVILLSAIIIKLESPGPIFYLQERVGERGNTFKVIKFRSMRQDAEKDGAVWASKNDARVTRYGGFIRKVRIDEIPQMLNVLKGEMSFVGPRPERPVFVHELSESIPYYNIRHYVKPGITGWAQVCYPYGASIEDALRKLEYDLYYMKNVTIVMDMMIIFKTIKTVLFDKSAH